MASVKSTYIFSIENGAALSQMAPLAGKKTALWQFLFWTLTFLDVTEKELFYFENPAEPVCPSCPDCVHQLLVTSATVSCCRNTVRDSTSFRSASQCKSSETLMKDVWCFFAVPNKHQAVLATQSLVWDSCWISTSDCWNVLLSKWIGLTSVKRGNHPDLKPREVSLQHVGSFDWQSQSDVHEVSCHFNSFSELHHASLCTSLPVEKLHVWL